MASSGSPPRHDFLVLVVDNDADLRNAVAAVLTECGFRVATAANGLQALHVVATERPTVVLLDMQMPVLDGVGFARRLAESGERVGIIVMSAFPVSQEELKEVGALAFIAKPFEINQLCHDLDRYTSGQAAAS
jgi:two-component system, chemotaxis family, chemotaxis protein CheY